ncbi:hypothetical protein G7Z17_g6524 [Cylindrodendrum hubeiense]|uniref:Uncharacterized protein n=1 Tax=Cylindrodendrum hubeiense TaxID=595255 RepID=A0A9P5HF19_9HYPO|nr:hypothetical protein G7Z17_g6524 [Cylindrodendrum hubeiense]
MPGGPPLAVWSGNENSGHSNDTDDNGSENHDIPPSPPSSSEALPIPVPTQGIVFSPSAFESILNRAKALRKPVNLTMTTLTLAALVFAIISYNQTRYGNLLNQMEACRQHPNDMYLQNTALCVKMRQDKDYDSDVSMSSIDISNLNSDLPDDAGNNKDHTRRSEQLEELRGKSH